MTHTGGQADGAPSLHAGHYRSNGIVQCQTCRVNSAAAASPLGRLQLAVRLHIAAGHRGLYAAVRFAGGHVHIVLKLRLQVPALRRRIHKWSCYKGLMHWQTPPTVEAFVHMEQKHCQCSTLSHPWEGRGCSTSTAHVSVHVQGTRHPCVLGSRAHLADDWAAGQKVQVGHVQED